MCMGHYTKSDGSCWLQRYAATRCNVMRPLATKHFTIIPPPISYETRHPVQSNPATGSEEVLNLYPIKGAARYLTVANFASAGRSLELAANATFRAHWDLSVYPLWI